MKIQWEADRFTSEILASDLAQLALEPQIDSARRLVEEATRI